MSLEVTLYTRPNGTKSPLIINNIDREQEEFFNGRYGVSMEELMTGEFALYADIGIVLHDESVEVTYVVPRSQSCKDAFKCLQKKVEDVINELC